MKRLNVTLLTMVC